MKISLIAFSFVVSVGGYTRNDCYCGISNSQSRRIANGVIATSHKYPWMIPLFTGKHVAHCGSALISDQHVLTAAHCISMDPRTETFWSKVYGKISAHHLKSGEAHKFISVRVHPKFKSYDKFDDYDLAILAFDKPLKLSSLVRPVCVPMKRQLYGGSRAVVAGWGTIDPDKKKMSNLLREGEIQVLHAIQCPAATSLHYLYNFKSMTCAFSSKHVDTCPGDSGGPLLIETSHLHFEVIGVSAFGAKCGGKFAGVYSDVTQSLPWVWSVINKTAGVCRSMLTV